MQLLTSAGLHLYTFKFLQQLSLKQQILRPVQTSDWKENSFICILQSWGKVCSLCTKPKRHGEITYTWVARDFPHLPAITVLPTCLQQLSEDLGWNSVLFHWRPALISGQEITLYSKSKLLNGPMIALNVWFYVSSPSFIFVHVNRMEFSFSGIIHQLRICGIHSLKERCELTLSLVNGILTFSNTVDHWGEDLPCKCSNGDVFCY